MRIILLLSLSLLLVGCSSIQTTSGKQYLKKFNTVPTSGVDKQVYETANIEPNLSFPCRIGLARIDNGCLTSIPSSELEAWINVSKELGEGYGDLVPISRLVANMVHPTSYSRSQSSEERIQEVIKKIRLGAARQHVDVVFIYEVYSESKSYITPAAIANVTIIGAWFSPSRKIKAKGYASGLLLDVRNGYPYGTADAVVKDSDFTTSVNKYRNENKMSEKIKSKSGIKLSKEVKEMFIKLKKELESKNSNTVK